MDCCAQPSDNELKTVEEAMKLIDKHAKYLEGFDQEAVEKLARFFLKKKFRVWVNPGTQDLVQEYWVGFGASRPGVLGFQPENGWNMGNDDDRKQIRAHVVPTTKVFPYPLEAVFEPRVFDLWRSLDFTDPASAPKIVLTTELSGCTLAIAAVDDTFYIGHAQPTSPPESGSKLADRLFSSSKWAGLPPRILPQPKSMCVIRPGNSPKGKPDVSTLCYGTKASVLGLLVESNTELASYKLCFIVAKLREEHEIVKIYRVTFDRAKQEWETEIVS